MQVFSVQLITVRDVIFALAAPDAKTLIPMAAARVTEVNFIGCPVNSADKFGKTDNLVQTGISQVVALQYVVLMRDQN